MPLHPGSSGSQHTLCHPPAGPHMQSVMEVSRQVSEEAFHGHVSLQPFLPLITSPTLSD